MNHPPREPGDNHGTAPTWAFYAQILAIALLAAMAVFALGFGSPQADYDITRAEAGK